LENVKSGEIEVKINCKKIVPSELEGRTRDLQNDIDNQTQKLEELSSNINDLINKNNDLSVANNTTQEEVNQLNNKKQSLLPELSNLRSIESDLEKQWNPTENELLTIEKEHKTVENLKNEKNEKLTMLKSEIVKLGNEIDFTLNEELQALKKKYALKQENDKRPQENVDNNDRESSAQPLTDKANSEKPTPGSKTKPLNCCVVL